MRDTARFPPVPASVTAARLWISELLLADELADHAPDAELCLSELAADAVRHAGTDFEVEISEEDGLVRIAVRDGSPAPVRPQQPGPTELSGRGLQIVASIANRWGVEPTPDGKTVWCILEL